MVFISSKADKGRTIKILQQTGQVKSIQRDLSRKALTPGKRISKNGKVYWETRINRSDALLKDI